MRRRFHFWIACRFASVDQFVFLDESSAKTNMTRLYGRAVRGRRCHDCAPHGHWRTTTMINAIRCTGVIEKASCMFEGATNADTFRNYVEQCLAPALHHGDIVVMDNLSSHKVAGVEATIEAVGATVWYLPPYSPDLNPIEKMWSKVKAWLRRAATRDFDALVEATGQALRAVSPAECQHYFQSCGYAT